MPSTATRPTVPTPARDTEPGWVVMLSGSPWPAACHRQQALAAQIALDYRVLFVDPPRNRPQWTFAVTQRAANLWHAVVPSPLPFGRQLPPANHLARAIATRCLTEWLDARPGPRILWVDEDLAAPTIGRLGAAATVYDATDLDWTFTRRWNRWHLRRALRTAVGAADVVLASSPTLPAHLPASRRPPVVVPNGTDTELYSPDGPIAPWLRDYPGPRIGYLGAIDTRAFDAPLLAAVARDHPEWTFLLAGPSTPDGRRPLVGVPNVHLVGRIPYAEGPAFLRGCDVGIIPYRVGGLIDYVLPKKYFDYLAVGLPVVSTPLPAMSTVEAPVRLAAGRFDVGAAIGAALHSDADPASRARHRAAALQNDWAVRGDQVRRVLTGLALR